MSTKKEQLDALLQFIDSLVADPENYADFTAKLKARFAGTDNANPLLDLDPTKIDFIYEYCIEQIAKEDAHSFYKDFCIPEIIPQLQEDFVKMEHWRRRGNLNEFSLALYQQFECMVNKLAENPQLNHIFDKLIAHHCITDGIHYDRPVKEREYPLYKLLFYPSKVLESTGRTLSNQLAMDKFRAILYLCHYGALLSWKTLSLFNSIAEDMTELYKVRCANHRGNSYSEFEKGVIERVNANPINFELKMMGLLAIFVKNVNKNFPKISELKRFVDEDLPPKKFQASEYQAPEIKIVGKIDLSSIK